MQSVGPKKAQEWVAKFGFDADKHPPYLPMALGAGAVTPMQMAAGYSVFANGGHRVSLPDCQDHRPPRQYCCPSSRPRQWKTCPGPSCSQRFVMDSLLQDVARWYGAPVDAQAPGIYGKTGTTNDAVDAWFAGFQPTTAAVVWMGYDNPRSLGAREFGGGLSLPIWINYMQHAAKAMPVTQMQAPGGARSLRAADWY